MLIWYGKLTRDMGEIANVGHFQTGSTPGAYTAHFTLFMIFCAEFLRCLLYACILLSNCVKMV